MFWLLACFAFGLGLGAGFWVRPYVIRQADRVLEGASSGVAVFMHGNEVWSRRKVKAPIYEQLRHHGRGAPDAYVYVGRNDADEYVYQKVED